jgi:putative ABC transport system substrate-binding protein
MLFNPTAPNLAQLRDVQAAAGVLGLEIRVFEVSGAGDFEPAFAAIASLRIGALMVGSDSYFNSQRERIVALAARHAVPAVYEWREFAAAGGLMSYGTNLSDGYRLVGLYAGRILKGAKPADLPIIQATTVEFVVNLKTAKTLGLTIPLPLLGRADEVIE